MGELKWWFTERRPISTSCLPEAGDGIGTRRVLCVEDDADCRKALVRLLTSAGFKACPAGSIAEALAAADAAPEPFDVLVTDLGLPDGMGDELLRRMAARGPIRSIALTGSGEPEDVLRVAEAGFDRHLLKPVSASELAEAIRRL